MPKKKIVITGGSRVKTQFIEHLISEKYILKILPEVKTNMQLLAQELHDADGYLLGGDEVITSEFLENTPRLQLIACMAIGANHFIDIDAATAKGIAVANTPEMTVMSNAVAEFTIGSIIALRRQIVSYNNLHKKGENSQLMTSRLSQAIVGIIGMGAVGKQVAQILRLGFESEVLYYNRTAKLELEERLGIKRTTLHELLQKSDIVVLLCSLNDETLGLIGSEELAMMKSTAFLINPASAPLINGPALYHALTQGKIAGATIDDFNWDEKAILKDNKNINLPIELVNLPDTMMILTPHIASHTEDSWDQMSNSAAQVVSRFFSPTDDAINIVNPEYLNNLN